MTHPIITVENLGKRYRLNHHFGGQRYYSLREAVVERSGYLVKQCWNAVRRPFIRGIPAATLSPSVEDFWALKGISLEIHRGESVGIIGKNGAGKSTLLKILSRITEPTTGRFRLRGRLASLLEVGTGFHSELTGKENIYLNGAILGMTRAEVQRKFDEIVHFAEVEKFLDTPVKRYSSGMYVRLAFAVAAHLEPEILVVDEVLAVGDAAFQKKCLGRMGEVASSGRTVLFVSHNMGAILQLCPRSILLHNGSIVIDDRSSRVVDEYLGSSGLRKQYVRDEHAKAAEAFMLTAKIAEPPQGRISYGEGIVIEAACCAVREISVTFEVIIRDNQYRPIIFIPSGLRYGMEFKLSPKKASILSCRIPCLPLAEGGYFIDLIIGGSKAFDWQNGILEFEVICSDPAGINRSFIQGNQGCVHLDAEFACSDGERSNPKKAWVTG